MNCSSPCGIPAANGMPVSISTTPTSRPPPHSGSRPCPRRPSPLRPTRDRVDIKPIEQWYQRFDGTEIIGSLDLRELPACRRAVKDAYWVYNLAADMGGMGFIENNRALCMLSVLINTHLLQAAREAGVERYFYSSSACVYNHDKQTDPGCHRSQGGGRLSGDAGGRLRMGKALQRTHVQALF